ncbi:hypothetical protein C7N83_04610 [Neisseria iguanae]|uniref:Uncharacterized protein n=1 Tax=Neisseria iguanae TaxID=90242 RepID=A0A2P7U163_9NEIS|nr:hypothetical protein C7N83_04610 [Neisseria iguanae]
MVYIRFCLMAKSFLKATNVDIVISILKSTSSNLKDKHRMILENELKNNQVKLNQVRAELETAK